MCRYATHNYKSHYACFECRKTFKRRLLKDIDENIGDSNFSEKQEYKCPQCGGMTADMGLDFESPKMSDVKAWNHIRNLYQAGITFHSCGCSGPGFIPRDRAQLVEHFKEKVKDYNKQLAYWRTLQESQNEEKSLNQLNNEWPTMGRVPAEARATIQDAKNYWVERIKDVEEKLRKL